jgi:hypothetical protein
MGKFGNVKWGNGEMGKWGNGKMGKWGNGNGKLMVILPPIYLIYYLAYC